MAVLNGVIRVGLIEKVTSEQREKGISHMSVRGREGYSWQDQGMGR